MISFCRANGVISTGGKIEIAGRIEQHLATGKVIPASRKPAATSNFDWKNSELHLNKKLTDNYKNTENVRAFMTLHIGSHFKFNTEFMNWAKNNAGKTLCDSIEEWIKFYKNRKDKKSKTEIAPQFEYNRFIRDFLNENPGKKLQDAIIQWKLIRNEKGSSRYKVINQ